MNAGPPAPEWRASEHNQLLAGLHRERACLQPTEPAWLRKATADRDPGRARATSLDTWHQPHSGSSRRVRRRHPRGPVDALARVLRDPAERQLTKLDFADVLNECARQAAADHEYERSYWFDERAAALRGCTSIRVIVHRACGSGVATPLSCHVRGCPDCERARVARLLARYEALADEMARPAFWTFTVRNVARGELGTGLVALRRDFGRLRRRVIFAGGPCRWRWRETGPDGQPDGAPGHPCHPPAPADDCLPRRCAPGCTARRGEAHLPGCAGCPTRTGRSRSRCLTHPPIELHPGGCPASCGHAGHRKDRNCPAFRHERVRGGAVASDITWSEDAGGTWHPHLHALLDAPWIGWAELRDTWQALTCRTTGCRHGWSSRCTGSWSIWVEAVSRDDPAERRGAIREVLKYVGKPHGIVDSLDPGRVAEYLWATRRQKLVTDFGDLYRVQVEEAEPAGAEELVIQGFGFATLRVPRVCPKCGRTTTEDDWILPDLRARLEAYRLPSGRYGWDPQPGTAGDRPPLGSDVR